MSRWVDRRRWEGVTRACSCRSSSNIRVELCVFTAQPFWDKLISSRLLAADVKLLQEEPRIDRRTASNGEEKKNPSRKLDNPHDNTVGGRDGRASAELYVTPSVFD